MSAIVRHVRDFASGLRAGVAQAVQIIVGIIAATIIFGLLFLFFAAFGTFVVALIAGLVVLGLLGLIVAAVTR